MLISKSSRIDQLQSLNLNHLARTNRYRSLLKIAKHEMTLARRLHHSIPSYASIAARRGFEQITKSNGHACIESRNSKDHI